PHHSICILLLVSYLKFRFNNPARTAYEMTLTNTTEKKGEVLTAVLRNGGCSGKLNICASIIISAKLKVSALKRHRA
ncbi:MAG TPA: hypothetical protein PLO59_00005, partial [Bacteroidia bacterium]|nr:hypothetical protein [Bacteroidia bacterium]